MSGAQKHITCYGRALTVQNIQCGFCKWGIFTFMAVRMFIVNVQSLKKCSVSKNVWGIGPDLKKLMVLRGKIYPL